MSDGDVRFSDARFLNSSLVRGDGQLDKAKLGAELTTAFEVDRRRKAEDEMKKRSILTCKNYDEFKAKVSVATLTPLTSREMDMRCEVAANKAMRAGAGGAPGAPAGSAASLRGDALGFGLLPTFGAAGGAQEAASTAAAAAAATAMAGAGAGVGTGAGAAARPQPRTASEFEKMWRRLAGGPAGAGARYAFLGAVGAERAGECFRADIDGNLLGAVLGALAAAAAAAAGAPDAFDARLGCALPLALARSAGFAMARAMMPREGRAAAAALAAAAEGAGLADEAAQMRAAYDV